MKCVFCGGSLHRENVTFVHDYGDRLLLIENVPAEVCEQCGEKTYSPEITDEIIKFARQQFKPARTVEVPVFDYQHQVLKAA